MKQAILMQIIVSNAKRKRITPLKYQAVTSKAKIQNNTNCLYHFLRVHRPRHRGHAGSSPSHLERKIKKERYTN